MLSERKFLWNRKYGGIGIWEKICAGFDCRANCRREKLCAKLQLFGCDIGRTTYAKYESGELNIRASVLIALHRIYSCSYDEFFAGLEKSEEE